MTTIKNLAVPVQRWDYCPASLAFTAACSLEATRTCKTLGGAAGMTPRLIADSYLMGGEL